jgi:hypothetical protein
MNAYPSRLLVQLLLVAVGIAVAPRAAFAQPRRAEHGETVAVRDLPALGLIAGHTSDDHTFPNDLRLETAPEASWMPTPG